MDMLLCDGVLKLCLVRCVILGMFRTHLKDYRGYSPFNWVDQWMMTRINGFNLDGSSQFVIELGM